MNDKEKKRKKKTLIIGGLLLLGLLGSTASAIGWIATRNKNKTSSKDTLPSTDLENKDAQIKKLNDLKKMLEDLLKILDSNENKELIEQLNKILARIDFMLKNIEQFNKEQLDIAYNQLSNEYEQILDKKKAFDINLVEQFTTLIDQINKYKALISLENKYDQVIKNLDELVKQIIDTKNLYPLNNLFTLEQIQKIKEHLNRFNKEFLNNKLRKVQIDIDQANAKKEVFLTSLGKPVSNKYVDLLEHNKLNYEKFEKIFELANNSENIDEQRIISLEKAVHNLINLIAINKLEKAHVDLELKLKNLIINNTISPLSPADKQIWDQLYKDAQDKSMYFDQTNRDVNKTYLATNEYINKAEDKFNQLTVKRNLQDILNNSFLPFIDQLRKDPEHKYDKIIDKLNKVTDVINSVLKNPNATIEDMKNAKDLIANAIEKAKEDKLLIDMNNTNDIDQLKAVLQDLINKVIDWKNTNIINPGLDYIKNLLDPAILSANRTINSDKIDQIRKEIGDLTEVFNKAKELLEEYNQTRKSLENKIVETDELLKELEQYPNIKAELEKVKNDVKSKINESNNEQLKELINNLDKAIQDAKDKMSNSELEQEKTNIKKLIDQITEWKNSNLTLTGHNYIKEPLEEILSTATEKLNIQDINELKKLHNDLEQSFNNSKTLLEEYNLVKNELNQTINQANEVLKTVEKYPEIKTSLESVINDTNSKLDTSNNIELKDLDSKLKEAIQDAIRQAQIKEREVIKNRLNDVIAEIQNYHDETNRWVDTKTFGSLKEKINDYINLAKQELNDTENVQDDIERYTNKYEELKNKFEEFKSEYDQLAKQKIINEINQVLTEAKNYLNNELSDSKYSDIKNELSKVINETETLLNSDLTNTTDQELIAQKDKLVNALEEAEKKKQNYDREHNLDKLAKLNDLIKEAQEYIKTNLTDEGEKSIKDELQNSITTNTPTQNESDQQLDEKYINLENSLNLAKNKEKERDLAKEELQRKKAEIEQFIANLGTQDIYNNLKNSLNNLISEANTSLTNDNAEQIKEKIKKLNDQLFNAQSQKELLDELVKLQDKINEVQAVIKENESYDSGLNSELQKLKDAKSSSETKLTNWKQDTSTTKISDVKEEINRLNDALNNFNKAKADREVSKKQLQDLINEATDYVNNTLGTNINYNVLKNVLEAKIAESTKATTTLDKTGIDQEIKSLRDKLNQIKSRKTVIDQSNQDINQSRTSLENLINQAKEWQNTNLRNPDQTSLKKQGYNDIDTELSNAITAATTVKEKQTSTNEELKQAYIELENQLQKSKTDFDNHNKEYANVENAIKELNDFVQNSLNDQKYNELKNKYQKIVDDSNSSKDNVNETKLKQLSELLKDSLVNAKKEKEALDLLEAKSRLQELINQAVSYSKDTNHGVGLDIYSEIKNSLTSVVDPINKDINNSQTLEWYNSNYNVVESALNKAKNDKLLKAKEIYNNEVTKANNVIATLNKNEPGEYSATGSPKAVFDETFKLNQLVDSDTANQIYNKAQNVKQAIDTLNQMKLERDKEKNAIDEKINSAKTLLIKLNNADIDQATKNALQSKIDSAVSAKTQLAKDGIIQAKNELEKEMTNSLKALRDKLKDWVAKSIVLKGSMEQYKNDIQAQYNKISLAITECQTNIDSIDENEIIKRITRIKADYTEVNNFFTEWQPLKTQLNAELDKLKAIQTDMNNQPDAQKVYWKWIPEVQNKLAQFSKSNTIQEIKNTLNGDYGIKSYIPAITQVVNGIKNVYPSYATSKELALKLQKLLEANSTYLNDFNSKVINPATRSDTSFYSSTDRPADLNNAKTHYDKALAVYTEKVNMERDSIQSMITTEVANNVKLVKDFSTITTSNKPEHKKIPLDKTALNERDALLKKYNTANPSDELNKLMLRVSTNNKPSIQEFNALKQRINELKTAQAQIDKILNDNWTRNGAKWEYELAKKELEKAFNNNLFNNTSTGYIDREVNNLRSTNTWTYTGNDTNTLRNYKNQIETLTNKYKTLAQNDGSKTNNSYNEAKSIRDSNISNFESLRQMMSTYDDDIWRRWEINHNEFNQLIRNTAINGYMVEIKDLEWKLLRKRQENTGYSYVDSFLHLEINRSMKALVDYWNAFGPGNGRNIKNYQTPLRKDSANYNTLKNFVFKFYRYETSGQNNSSITLWNNYGKSRYWNNKPNSNYNYEVRTWETNDYNNNNGILDYARRDWAGGTAWDYAERTRALNMWDIWYRDGLIVLYWRVWGDIIKMYNHYEELKTQYSNKEINVNQLIQYKIDLRHFVDNVYMNGYNGVDKFSIKRDLFYPANLNDLARFITEHDIR
ncbi:hypothetical protein [Mycoplasmopsis anatis]|uniref:hypothetical protein n=1 Tax=Mycoplasmopsis anatis TaxID=171279 RepID=UPI001C4E21C9|nr:hypothetical protein [Mycoplasmopsis anatis]MBW0603819.1 hypothetical protein [Mycoplasmopsis anatis]